MELDKMVINSINGIIEKTFNYETLCILYRRRKVRISENMTITQHYMRESSQ